MNGYRPDRGGTGALMRSSEVADHLQNVAEEEARRFAESIAPRDTGEYAGAFQTVRDEAIIARERRAVVRLENTAGHAGAVESRTHVLSRTRDHIESTHG